MNNRILCIGEVLWDALPLGLFPGGAPYNVAVHLRSLGEEAVFISRVGQDELGREIKRRLARQGLSPREVQEDHTYPTGFVRVTLGSPGDPGYDILKPAAWDAIELTNRVIRLAAEAGFIVFGSLAQRGERSRETIRQVIGSEAVTVFDVNLRPPYDYQNVVEESLHQADVVKMNAQELATFIPWFQLETDFQDAIVSLSKRFGCSTICVTRGEEGALLYHREIWYDHPGYRIRSIDGVGAGDAFLAALISRLLVRKDEPQAALEFANLVGAYVATQNGATPALDAGNLAHFRDTVRTGNRSDDAD